MFCPQCGHRQVSNEMRFCSRCGLPLDTVTDLLDDSAKTLPRKKRGVTGIGLMMATVLMLMNFIIVFGAITLPHLTNPVFLWIWASFVMASLIIGGIGVTNLIRGGFFKRLKAREVNLHLMKNRPEVAEVRINDGTHCEIRRLLETLCRCVDRRFRYVVAVNLLDMASISLSELGIPNSHSPHLHVLRLRDLFSWSLGPDSW